MLNPEVQVFLLKIISKYKNASDKFYILTVLFMYINQLLHL